MKSISASEITESLRAAGLSNGETVFLYTDLRAPGMINEAKSREQLCKIYLNSLIDVIGSSGTIVVPTYTTQVARFDLDFICEETETPMGIFPEFIRSRAESVRSLHPLFSLTALGPMSESICKNNGVSSHGVDSPFDRMLKHGAKILSIGLPADYAVGIAHHLEAACGLPYVYNKLLKWKVVHKGVTLERSYFACVRFPEFMKIRYRLGPFAERVDLSGGLGKAPLGDAMVYMTDYQNTFRLGAEILKDDPYLFLEEEPEFVYGKIPFDGPTASHDRISKQDDLDKLDAMNWSGYYL